MTLSEHDTQPAMSDEMPPWLAEQEEEDPRARAARELLVHKHLGLLHAESEKRKRAQVGDLFTKPGQREPADLDGAPLGNVRVDHGATGWKVTDPHALLEWTMANRPDEVEERIPVAELEAILERVTELAHPDETLTGSVRLGELRDALRPRATELQARPLFAKALEVAAKNDQVVEVDDRMMSARHVPGLSYVEAPPKLVVTVAKGEEGDRARAAVLARLGQAAAALGIDARPELEQ